MLRIRLRGLALDQMNSPVVILEAENSNKGFGIWIGPFEAEALALAISGKSFPRPLTYDLFINTMNLLGVKFDRALIHSVKENIYYASLVIVDNTATEKFLDARPSDCLVLAAKYGFPLFVDDKVFLESAIDLDKLKIDYNRNSEPVKEEFKEFVDNMDIDELKRYLNHKKGQEDDESNDAE